MRLRKLLLLTTVATACVAARGPAFATPAAAAVRAAAPVAEPLVVYVSPPPHDGATEANAYINPNAEAAFRGTVLRVERRCVAFSAPVGGAIGNVAGVLQLDLEVSEVFWGVVGERATIHVLGYDVPDCHIYGQPWPVPPAEQVVVGAHCLVGAQNLDGALVVSRWGSLVVEESLADGAALGKVHSRWGQYSEAEQLRAADVAVDAELTDVSKAMLVFRTIHRLKGDTAEKLMVPTCDAAGNSLPVGPLGQVSRLYLARVEDHYVPLYGRYSVQAIAPAPVPPILRD